MISSRTLRALPDTGVDLSKGLLFGEITQVTTPVVENKDTQILFNKKHYGWRYDGKEFSEDESGIEDPLGVHWMEELRDDEERPYTENYVEVGHCPYGQIGDALLVNGVVLEIKDVYLELSEDKDCSPAHWVWVMKIALIET